MQRLNIKFPERTVVIDLTSMEMTVAVNPSPPNQEAAPSMHAELEWSDTLLDGEPVTYEKAEAAAKALGDGWRLPTRQELESILDLSRHDPAVDTDTFPDTESKWYWTSTPCAWREDAVWCVFFYGGYVGYSPRYGGGGCVRAVRSGQ